MKKAQTLSLIIPVYNEESYLEQCLEAIARQTVKPLEVIVVDNNSTDASVKIAQSFPFVTVLHEKRQSVLYARTTGFNAATGDIIGRIDADTRIEPHWVERALATFNEHPEVAAISGPTAWYDLPFHPGNRLLVDFVAYWLLKLDGNFPLVYGANMALRRSAWQTIKTDLCTTKRYHEDVDIAIHLSQNDMPIRYDRHFSASISTRRGDDSLRSFRGYNNDRQITYRHHGLDPWGSKVAQAMFIVGWVLCWPWRHSYDEKTHRRSLLHLFNGRNEPRKHPMH